MADPRARFQDLYGAHGRAILGFAVRRTAQPADAADLVADVFLVAWRRLDDVPAGDDARLWLYGVARRLLANQRRGDRRRARLGSRLAAALSEHAFSAPDPADGLDHASGVRAAMGRLSTDDREVLQLAGWEGLSAAEMAAVLGVPAATARTRLHRARARLRLALATEEARASQEGDVEHPEPPGHEEADERPLVRDHEDLP